MDSPRCSDNPVLARVAIYGRLCRDGEFQTGVAFDDGGNVSERIHHHADTTIDKILNLVDLLQICGSADNRVCLDEVFDQVHRTSPLFIAGQRWFAVLEHAASRGPGPREDVVLSPVWVCRSQRSDPALHTIHGLADLLSRGLEFTPG